MAQRPKAVRDPEKLPVPAAEQPAPGSWWKRHWVPVLALWALALLAYSNSFRDGLIYDNDIAVKHDSRVHQATAENLRLILTKDYWYGNSTSQLYRPVATVSYLFNYAVLGEGENPAGYHAVNLLLHAVNITLVYLLGLLLMTEIWPAFAMAAIWAVHPVLTESVTNIVGRADLLAAMGVLTVGLCYAQSVTARGRRVLWWQGGVLAASAVAIFSKESGIVAVAALFLYDMAWSRERPARVRIAGYVAAALPVVAFLIVRSQVLQNEPLTVTAFTDNPLVGAGFLEGRLTAIKVLGKYLWLLVWPAGLSCDYSYNQIPLFAWNFGRWEDWQAIVSLLLYTAAAGLGVMAYRRSKPLFFLIGLFFAAIAPTANVFLLIGTIMAERTLYLPSIAFVGCIAWGGWQAYQRLEPRIPALRVAVPAALAVVCLGLCSRTFARNFDWYDDLSLWTSAVRVSPQSYRPHQHVASALTTGSKKDLDAADREAEQAVAIMGTLREADRVAPAYATAGAVYRLTGEARGENGGAEWYRKALQVLLEGVKADQAWDRDFAYQNKLVGKTTGSSHYVKVYLELARTYRDLGEYKESLNALNPDNWSVPQPEFFEEASVTFLKMGDPRQAAIALIEGIAMATPEQTRLAAEVVDIYQKSAAAGCALEGQGDKASLNFRCPQVREDFCYAHRNAAAMYHQLHRDSDALKLIDSAEKGLGCPAEMMR